MYTHVQFTYTYTCTYLKRLHLQAEVIKLEDTSCNRQVWALVFFTGGSVCFFCWVISWAFFPFLLAHDSIL